MAMFPDSGVPPADAHNSLPDVNTMGCDELWYSTSRCQPRFDPAAANAMLAEDMNLIMRGEVQYNCNTLDNIERAVRYINQRGLPRGAYMNGGPNAYTAVLDPPATRHNDYMTLTIVPGMHCAAGGVTLDIGLGPAYILRNDGLYLEREDLRLGKPTIIAFWGGYWHMVGLAASQVPIVVKGGLDFWIRTDGNDITGDGTANTADKAFKTIAGCWAAVGSRFAATPSFSINMKLGLPGTYVGALIGPFGGLVTLTGDPANYAAYRIAGFESHPNSWVTMWINNISSMNFNGVTLVMDQPLLPAYGLRCQGSMVAFFRGAIDVMVTNATYILIEIQNGGQFVLSVPTGYNVEDFYVNGNGHTISSVIQCHSQGNLTGGYKLGGQQVYWHFSNIVCAQFAAVSGLSNMNFSGADNIISSNVVGRTYIVSENSIINMQGMPIPGTVTGLDSTGGRFIP